MVLFAAQDDSVIRRYAFKPQPFLTTTMIVVFVAAPLVFGMPLLRDLATGASSWSELWMGAAAYAALVAIVCLLRALVWSPVATAIVLHADHLELPRSAASKRRANIPYSDLLSINAFGGRSDARLLLGTASANFVYSVAQFADGEQAAVALFNELRDRIGARPEGAAQLRAMQQRDAIGRQAMQARTRFSPAIVATLVLAYAWTWSAGAFDDPLGLARFGANVPALISSGQWYRLFAANFLHANLLHLYLNAMAIYSLGSLLERLIGSWRVTAIYLVSAFGGSAASAWTSNALLSVGASTAAFGLLGALALLHWRFGALLPGGFRQSLRWWIVILGINAALPIFIPVIDFAAHVGGFAAGAAVTAFLCGSRACIVPPHAVTASTKALATLLSLLCILSLGETVVRATTEEPEVANLRLARQLLSQPGGNGVLLNNLAWTIVTRVDASRAELELARDAAASVVEGAPDEPSFIDTLATAYYRLGDYDRAVATELTALALDGSRLIQSQLGRFLEAHLERSGPMSVNGANAASIRIYVDGSGGAGSGAIVLDLARTYTGGIQIVALDRSSGRLEGTLHVVLGPGVEAGALRIDLDDGGAGIGVAEGRELVVAYVDGARCDCEPGTRRSRYHRMDPEVARLP